MNRDTSAGGSSPMATLDAIHAQQRSNLERRRPLLARYEEVRLSLRRARKAETVERLREEFDRLGVELAAEEAEFHELVAADIAEVRRLTALLQAAVEGACAPAPASDMGIVGEAGPVLEATGCAVLMKAPPVSAAIRSPGIAEFVDALPLTEWGKEELTADIVAAEAMVAGCARDGSFGGGHPMGRAIGLFVYLTDKGWPQHFAAACAMAETDTAAVQMLTPLGLPPGASDLLHPTVTTRAGGR